MRRILLQVLFAATPLLAQEVNRAPEWWQVAGGVVSIPVTLLSIAVTYFSIRKTRLEARKTELEIAEKEVELRKVAIDQSALADELMRPLQQTRVSQLLVIRFIVLYIVLNAWSLLSRGVELIATGSAFGLLKLLGRDDQPIWLLAPFAVVSYIPKVMYWVVFFSMGWPLLRDATAVLGFDLRDVLRLRRTSHTPAG